MNQFENEVGRIIQRVNPRAEYEFCDGTLFILTDNAVNTYDAHDIIDAIKHYTNATVSTGRVGSEIYVDFTGVQK
jgi:hypothetical protein